MGARSRGGALLAVLWLSAALAAIAFSLAATVRGELDRTSTTLDGARAYYLATGAIERTLLYMQWARRYPAPDGSPRYFPPGTTSLHFSFPMGDAQVSVLPETAKLGVNSISPVDLLRLLSAIGASPEQAQQVALAIADWRVPPPEGGPSEFDRYYLGLNPSFRASHASFQNVEELLPVKGITPELFFGAYERSPQGGLVRRFGLKDCLSVYASSSRVDVNTAPPPVLAAVGLDTGVIGAILEARARRPFSTLDELSTLGLAPAVSARLTVGGAYIYELRATARLRSADGQLSDLSRTVGATVSMAEGPVGLGYRTLRWQDWAWAGNEP